MFRTNQFYNLYFSWRVKYKKIISFNIYIFNFSSIFNQTMLTPNWTAQFKLNRRIEQVFKIFLNYDTLIFNHGANETVMLLQIGRFHQRLYSTKLLEQRPKESSHL